MGLDLLRKVPLFQDLTQDELERLLTLVEARQCRKNETIVLEKQIGNAMFIIKSGKVKVIITDKKGREVLLDVFGEGDFFGELALLDNKPRSANVIALTEDTELLVLRRDDLYDLVQRNPGIIIKFLVELTARLRKADERIENLALLDAAGRISRSLMELGAKTAVREEGVVFIENMPTHRELASLCGTTRETVTRILRRLEKGRYIAYRGKGLVISENRPLSDLPTDPNVDPIQNFR